MTALGTVAALLAFNIVTQEVVAPGVTFTEYRLPTPNDVFVVAVERGRAEYDFRDRLARWRPQLRRPLGPRR
jgi:hypothetical protein